MEIEIRRRDALQLKRKQWLLPDRQFAFWVEAIPLAEHGYVISGFSPSELWVEQNDTMQLCMDPEDTYSVKTSGVLVFQNSASGERFALVLGAPLYFDLRIWLDIIPDVQNRSADDIRRGLSFGLQAMCAVRDRYSVGLSTGRLVSVATRFTNFGGSREFCMTDITIV
jgi:hypothetical protein